MKVSEELMNESKYIGTKPVTIYFNSFLLTLFFRSHHCEWLPLYSRVAERVAHNRAIFGISRDLITRDYG